MREGKHFDNCSCSKISGLWGDAGWHNVELTAANAAYWLEKHLTTEFRSQTGEEPGPKAAATIKQRAKDLAPTYIGTTLAVERCPAWEAQHKRKVERLRAEKRAAGKKARKLAE